jgi:homoserine kinase
MGGAITIRLASLAAPMPPDAHADVPRPARVRVPASTSNLGPGFDVLGLALDIALEAGAQVDAERADCALETREGTARDWPEGPRELLAAACEHAFRELGGRGGLRLWARSEIPVGRGLGSSGAAIAAGLLLGSHFAPRRASRTEVLGWAVEIEGHPDNVAPALFGGCQLTCPREGAPPRAVAVDLHPELGFAVAWPEAQLETAFARTLLASHVPLAQAVDTARRLALVIQGLRTGDPELLGAGNVEHLHVPHRLPHIPGGAAALLAAREAGASLATISGAGSALFAVTTRARASQVAQAMQAAFARAGAGGEARVVRPVLGAPVVETG